MKTMSPLKRFIKLLYSFIFAPFYILDFFKFKKKLKSTANNRFTIHARDFYPCISDKTTTAGFDRHYLYHPAWAAKIVAETRPKVHTDISSALYFGAIVSAFVDVDFYDYRPANIILPGFKSGKADLTNLHFETSSIQSLSCMHTIEHIGLGRYGDPIDPNGDIIATKELARVLAPNGNLIFVVPVAKESRIDWNAHRVYSYKDALGLFPSLKLKEFSLIPESESSGVGIIKNADPSLLENETYACGLFLFTKEI